MSDRTFRTTGGLDVDPDLDLEACHTDPIHQTASVQPHGAFLELDPESAEVRSASTNVEDFTGRTAAELLGRRVDTVLGDRGVAHVRSIPRSGGAAREQFVREISGERQLLTFFPVGETVGVEIERLRDQQGAPEELMADVLVLVERLRGRTVRDELFEATVRSVRSISGFDRVMLYRFDEEGHGSVLAEEVARPGMVSYSGHRFPASDIPEPARRLYRKNRIRYIPDVAYDPVPIVGPEGERDRWELDLTYSSLRGVPSVHRQYLSNMNVGASSSFSLMVEGELWGLIACHGVGPHHLDWPRRSICAQIALTTAQQLERIRGEERDRRLRAVDGLRARVSRPSETGGLFELLEANRDELLSFMDARFFFLRLDDEMLWIGSGEVESAPDGLVEHLSRRLEEDKTAEVRSIVGEVDETWAHSELICGYLAFRLGASPHRFCAWLRPEERETIEWGGDPRHPVQSSDGGSLSPRGSFETWTQIVTDRCPAWTEMDRVTARELAQLLDELIIDVQADRLRRANQTLEKLARTDDLTGLANRREVQRKLETEVERARRYGSPLSAVILDLDHFKTVNDRYGHQAGDRVLERVARLFRETVRSSDIVGRYGGEEFALVLPETGRKEATELAGRILEGVRKLSIDMDGETIDITSSAGVATLLDREESPDELMRRADDALYRAKEAGRDRVVAD